MIAETWYVYVLLSEATGRTYVGVAINVEKRLLEHNGILPGGAKATRGWRPWAIGRIFGPLASRSEACKLEHKIKKRRGRKRLLG